MHKIYLRSRKSILISLEKPYINNPDCRTRTRLLGNDSGQKVLFTVESRRTRPQITPPIIQEILGVVAV